MTAGVAAARSPALGVVAPFFLVAPLGLVAAGLLIAGANSDSFVAVNLPRNVAATHGVVIGWLTTSIMGATYQLSPVVMGGDLLSVRITRVQLYLHVASIALFIWSLWEWDVRWMGVAGAGLYISLLLFALNISVALARGKSWSHPRAFVTASTAFLVLAMSFGLTYVGALQPEHAWFGITLGRLSAHAHLGLVGWLALTLMGVGYQLIPMFNVINRAKPRFGWAVLAITGAATALFGSAMLFDPPVEARVVLAALLALGPALWGIDQVLLMRSRSKRRVDIQGRATYASLFFLAAVIPFGLAASAGTPLTPDGEPARWLLSYAALGMLGWLGSTLVGNSYKILSFLIWFHRYRPLVGREPVPVASEIYSEGAATAVLALNGLAALVLALAGVSGNIGLWRAGGLLLAAVGPAHAATMLYMFLPKKARRAAAPIPVNRTVPNESR